MWFVLGFACGAITASLMGLWAMEAAKVASDRILPKPSDLKRSQPIIVEAPGKQDQVDQFFKDFEKE